MKIRDAQDGDHAAVAHVAQHSDLLTGDLDERAFPGMLRWLYVQPPEDVRVQFVAEHDGAVVAHYGAVPFRYKLLDRICTAGFASNLVIDKDHRAGMLFISLQSYLQRAYRDAGFAFVYGLITRANVLEPHLRTGWKKIGAVPVYVKPFDVAAVASPFIANPALRAAAQVPLKLAGAAWRAGWRSTVKGVEVAPAASFGADADAFLASFMAAREITAVRDRAILNWRFTENAERRYRIFIARRDGRVTGYVVTRRMPLKHLDALAVVDLAFHPDDAVTGTALLRRCDDEAKRARVDVAAAIMNPHSPFAPFLRRFGYVVSPESFTLVVHAPKDGPEPKLTPELFGRWHLTWFEHDFV